jgi:hypothetical protein
MAEHTIPGMGTYQSSRQPDLFTAAGQAFFQEPPSADLVTRIRDELTDTLARVREAAALPWKDLTAATLAELRFNSIAGWLPADEARVLRIGFQREMNRLYTVAAATDET